MVKNKKKKNEVEEFIPKFIRQVKSGIPKDCVLSSDFNFDISVVTTRKNTGKLDIFLANIEHVSDSQQVHRIKFSIADKKSRDENAKYLKKVLGEFLSGLSKLDQSK